MNKEKDYRGQLVMSTFHDILGYVIDRKADPSDGCVSYVVEWITNSHYTNIYQQGRYFESEIEKMMKRVKDIYG